MARAYLIVAGLMWVAYGIYLLAVPQALAGTAGVSRDHADRPHRAARHVRWS